MILTRLTTRQKNEKNDIVTTLMNILTPWLHAFRRVHVTHIQDLKMMKILRIRLVLIDLLVNNDHDGSARQVFKIYFVNLTFDKFIKI